MLRFSRLLFVLVLLVSGWVVMAQDDTEDRGVLNIYSARHYGAMEAPFVAFEEATGIEVRVTQGSPRDLLARLRADIERGGRSPADLFLAIDAGVLSIATEEGLLQPVTSDVLEANIPQSQRDPEGHWYGLSQRLRTVVYNPANVTEEEIANLNNYADLADPVWDDRLCMRPASHIYTVSWTSSLIHNLGEDETRRVIEGIADNVVRYINSDTGQIRAVAAGECDVALVNHYYMGRLSDSEGEDRETFESVQLKWMNQDTTGVFYNINGAGIIVNAANYENALTFLEYFSGTEGQSGDVNLGLPGSNHEFPTNPEAEPNENIAQFGDYMLDTGYALWQYGALQSDAVTLLEEAGFGFSEN